MEYKDYYQLLGLDRGASPEEIKRNYRKMARKYHPDVSKEADAEAKFKDINEAYEVLKDPEKRAAYDQLGANWREGQNFEPPPDWQQGFNFGGGGFTEADASEFSDFFGNLFGGGGFGRRQWHSSGQRAKPENSYAKIQIDVEDSYQSPTKQISLPIDEVDHNGHILRKSRNINIKIPKGIYAGQHIRLTGQGPVLNGQAGDLYLEVAFNNQGYCHVEKKDVYVDLNLAPWEAALGGKVKVKTPAGELEVNVPPNSQAGKKLRLKGKGIPAKEPGDLYLIIQIVLPPANTEAQKAAYQQFMSAFKLDSRRQNG